MTAGGLRWGVRASFLDYLRGLDDGEVAATGDASFDGGGFEFPLADAAGFDPASGRGVLAFSGAARFRGHGGMLDLLLADPHLECTDEGVLTVAVDGRRVPFATVGLRTGWTDAPTALTREGAALLNDVYRPGTQLDPLSVWIDFGRR